MKNSVGMRELTYNEIEEVNGGIAPLIIYGAIVLVVGGIALVGSCNGTNQAQEDFAAREAAAQAAAEAERQRLEQEWLNNYYREMEAWCQQNGCSY